MSDRWRGIFQRRGFLSWVSLMLVTCLVIVSCGKAPEVSNSPSAAGMSSEITVATEDDYPPFDFLENGQHVGYNQALLDLIAKEKSLKIKQEILPFQGILAGIASNKYTASNSAIGITAKRAEVVDFTMPITELTNFFLIRKGDTTIKSTKDFAGKTIAVQQGGITAAVLKSHAEPELEKMGLKVGNVKEYSAFAEAYQDLLNKRVDLVFNNIVALKRLVSEKPDLYEIGGQVGPKVYASWAVKKGNKAMLDVLNDGLAKVKASGEMKALQEKWLKVTFDLPDTPVIPPA
ncbi:transporter substrate-binding domain-containing protein [Phormidium sp. FACHB-592]|nr:transporter substrate-binding domain-containing protein [Phormidium sp. FACHB-592]